MQRTQFVAVFDQLWGGRMWFWGEGIGGQP
jgi:hypothetical protein